MKNFTLDERLSCAAKFVRQGARFADIGTDHAYLPIFLLKSGVIDYAVCSDINEGPLASARENAREAGVFDKIDFTLANGADKLSDKNVTDVAICGMGGELIADIITRAQHLRRDGVRLILQPMSKSAATRRALAALGFRINDECYSESQGKLYVTICADYTAQTRDIDEREAELGAEVFLIGAVGVKREYLLKKLHALRRAADGKRMGGEEDSLEHRLCLYLEQIL